MWQILTVYKLKIYNVENLTERFFIQNSWMILSLKIIKCLKSLLSVMHCWKFL